jgi:zinc protease
MFEPRRCARGGIAVLLAAALAASSAATALATPLQLPPVKKTTLANGLVVFVMPTHRVPMVDFRLVARAGSVNDPPGKEGLASLTAALLT